MVASVQSIVTLTKTDVSTVAMMNSNKDGLVGWGVTGGDIEFIRVLSPALPFSPFPLCQASGLDLSRPSGYELITSRDREELRRSEYKPCHCGVCVLRAFVPGETGSTTILTHHS